MLIKPISDKSNIYRATAFACCIMAWLFVTPSAWAAVSGAGGLGDIANNIMEPVVVVSGFLASASLILGIACLFSSLIRYMQHRVNPLAHPISTVITLFILGLALLVLPLVNKLTSSGISFSLPH